MVCKVGHSCRYDQFIQVLAVKNRWVAVTLMQSDKVREQVKKLALRKIKDSFRISKEDKEYFAQIIKT